MKRSDNESSSSLYWGLMGGSDPKSSKLPFDHIFKMDCI